MTREDIISAINNNETALGIEFGSTRIKSVLINKQHEVIANGSFTWENRYENNLWVYHLDDAEKGLQISYKDLVSDVAEKYGIELTNVGAIGISGMMHGIIAVDKNNTQLSPFLTWRNTNTSRASEELSKLFDFNVPLRWTISQIYEAILNNEEYVKNIDYVSTLSGYIHRLLSGTKVTGIGEASGMFPIDSVTNDYDRTMIDKFNSLIGNKYPWKIEKILPKVLVAGDDAGTLTAEGALLIDPTGKLKPGIPMAPPEGDAGTGMTATNSVRVRTGNVSAGTSIFSMVVLERPLSKLYKDIDMVTTPSGKPVAMVHCNNGTSELDTWMKMFMEIVDICGGNTSGIYPVLFKKSLEGAPDCNKVILYNYMSGEPVTGTIDGRPLLLRTASSKMNLATFMRSQIYSIVSALAIGNRILVNENVKVDKLYGHGGLFKTAGVAQKYLAAAMKAPVICMKTAGEGGPYGMALLAMYLINKGQNETLEDYLDNKVYKEAEETKEVPSSEDIQAFDDYINTYIETLEAEKTAVKILK